MRFPKAQSARGLGHLVTNEHQELGRYAYIYTIN